MDDLNDPIEEHNDSNFEIGDGMIFANQDDYEGFLKHFTEQANYAALHNLCILIKDPLKVRYLEEWLNETFRKLANRSGIFTSEFKDAINTNYFLEPLTLENTPSAKLLKKMHKLIDKNLSDKAEEFRDKLKLFIYDPKELIFESNNPIEDINTLENIMLLDDECKEWWFSEEVSELASMFCSITNELEEVKRIFLRLI